MEDLEKRVVAKCNIPKGTEIMCAFPLICSPSDEEVPYLCHFCFKRFKSLSRCSRCKLVRYCSKQCQVADWKYHRVECPVFKVLSDLEEKDTTNIICQTIMLLRYIFMISTRSLVRDYHSLEVDINKTQLCKVTTSTEIYLLLSDYPKQDDDEIIYCEIVEHLLTLIRSISESPPTMTKESVISMYKVYCSKSIKITSLNRVIGSAIYPVISCLSLSEEPNTTYYFSGNVLFLSTTQQINKGESLTFPFVSCSYPVCLRQPSFKQRYIQYNIKDEKKKHIGYLMGLRCPKGHTIIPRTKQQKQLCDQCKQDYLFSFPVCSLFGLDYTTLLNDFAEYESKGKSCTFIIRQAESELNEDNYLLLLLHQACRDHFCHNHSYEMAQYSAYKVVEYMKAFQPDLVNELANELLILAGLLVRGGSTPTALQLIGQVQDLMSLHKSFSREEVKEVTDIQKKWEMSEVVLSNVETY